MAICRPAQIKGGVGARTGPSLSKANIGNAFRRPAGGIRTNYSDVVVRYCNGGSAGVGGKLSTRKAFAVGARLSPRQVIVTQFREYVCTVIRFPIILPQQRRTKGITYIGGKQVAGFALGVVCI